MDTRYNGFLDGMNSVYERFQVQWPEIVGTTVGAIVAKEHELYAIIMRYDNRVNDTVARMSEGVGKLLASIPYSQDVVHTTVLDTIPNTTRDKSLEWVLSTLWGMYFKDLSVNFWAPIANSNSIILPGIPTESFVWLSDQLAKSIERFHPNSGPRIKKPWGAHVTVSRFLESRDTRVGNEVKKVLSQFEAIWTVRPVSLEVWAGTIGPTWFRKNTLSELMI